MSSGQTHRDPWNFPRMKWRARKRLTGPQRLAVLRRSQIEAGVALAVESAARWPLPVDPEEV